MLNQAAKGMLRLYSPRLLIVMLVISAGFLWLLNAAPLPLSIDMMKAVSGEQAFDGRLYYDANDVRNTLTALGDTGRAIYLNFLLADYIFLIIYSVTLSLALTGLLKNCGLAHAPLLSLNLLPFAVAVMDVLENTNTLTLLLSYPNINPTLASAGGWLTLGKYIALAVTFLAIIALLAKRGQIYFSSRPA